MAIPEIYTIRAEDDAWCVIRGEQVSAPFASRRDAALMAKTAARADGREGHTAVLRLQEGSRLRILGVFGRGADPLPLLR